MGGAKRTEIKGGVDVSGTGSVPEGSGIPRGNSICWLQESNGSFLLGFLYLFTGGLDQMNKFQDTARSWWTWSCSGKKAGNPKKAHLWPNCADLAAIKSLLAQLQRKKKISCFLPIRCVRECRYENVIYRDTHFKMLWGRCFLTCVCGTTARSSFVQIGSLLFAPCLSLAGSECWVQNDPGKKAVPKAVSGLRFFKVRVFLRANKLYLKREYAFRALVFIPSQMLLMSPRSPIWLQWISEK